LAGSPRKNHAGLRRTKSAKNKRTTMYTVYILKCADNKYYTGCTENLKERIGRHDNGYVPATESRRPIQLIAHVVLNNKYKAFEFEKYLKSGSGRAFAKKHLV
jgi:putative endonuclease